jgi:hypothetical protein
MPQARRVQGKIRSCHRYCSQLYPPCKADRIRILSTDPSTLITWISQAGGCLQIPAFCESRYLHLQICFRTAELPAYRFGAKAANMIRPAHSICGPAYRFGAKAANTIRPAHSICGPAYRFGAKAANTIRPAHSICSPAYRFGAKAANTIR